MMIRPNKIWCINYIKVLIRRCMHLRPSFYLQMHLNMVNPFMNETFSSQQDSCISPQPWFLSSLMSPLLQTPWQLCEVFPLVGLNGTLLWWESVPVFQGIAWIGVLKLVLRLEDGTNHVLKTPILLLHFGFLCSLSFQIRFWTRHLQWWHLVL